MAGISDKRKAQMKAAQARYQERQKRGQIAHLEHRLALVQPDDVSPRKHPLIPTRPEIINWLSDIARNSESPAARVQACRILLDVKETAEDIDVEADRPSDEELAALGLRRIQEVG